jgi:3-phenylpropionate/trans-cinnamate dioxygenase ferredoxin reductase subunit
MSDYRYVIIGGGLAGGKAAEALRKADADGSIALVTDEPHRPYERPPLSKEYLLGQEGGHEVFLQDESFYADNAIEVHQGVAATRIDRAAKQLDLADGRVIGYDKLLLATGASARQLPLPGHDLAGVYTLRTIDDADQIREAAKTARQALVVGGSFMGCEVAAALSQLGLQVTMVFPERHLLQVVGPEALNQHLEALYAQRGIRILNGTKPLSLAGEGGRVRGVVLDDGQTLDSDLVVLGVGAVLNTTLASGAGLQMGPKGSVLVDATLRTSDPSIYAAGDIARWPEPTLGTTVQVEHWDVARRQGRQAGQNMAGEGSAYTALPYFYSDLFEFSFEAWGTLAKWDQSVLRGSLHDGRLAYYYFDGGILVGALLSSRPKAETKATEALVKARLSYADVAAHLADESHDITGLVP